MRMNKKNGMERRDETAKKFKNWTLFHLQAFRWKRVREKEREEVEGREVTVCVRFI